MTAAHKISLSRYAAPIGRTRIGRGPRALPWAQLVGARWAAFGVLYSRLTGEVTSPLTDSAGACSSAIGFRSARRASLSEPRAKPWVRNSTSDPSPERATYQSVDVRSTDGTRVSRRFSCLQEGPHIGVPTLLDNPRAFGASPFSKGEWLPAVPYFRNTPGGSSSTPNLQATIAATKCGGFLVLPKQPLHVGQISRFQESQAKQHA